MCACVPFVIRVAQISVKGPLLPRETSCPLKNKEQKRLINLTEIGKKDQIMQSIMQKDKHVFIQVKIDTRREVSKIVLNSLRLFEANLTGTGMLNSVIKGGRANFCQT